MAPLRKLAGQTAIYGVSSIVGRLLNYMLVPFYTRIFSREQFGVVTEMYAFVAFLVVLLTYGMETAFFRYSSKTGQPARVYATVLFSVISTSALFILMSTLFSVPIGEFLGYPNHTEYIIWFAIIVGLDAISSIPMARLRQLNKAQRFMLVSLTNVVVNIGLNLFFLVYCKGHYDEFGAQSNTLVQMFYSPEIGVGYVFISNLVASIVKLLMLGPQIFRVELNYDWALMRSMLRYALPLMILGLAGIINETIDRVLLKHLLDLPLNEALAEVGIYGASYKVAMIMSLGIQAFRYAAEPFFFAEEQAKNAKETYASVMRYFVIVSGLLFLGIMLFIDVVMQFVGEDFREGQAVVPILLMAYVFYGIVFNLSFWFKLSERTTWGAVIAIVGAVITLVLNFTLIPIIGYMGSAWATFASYGTMMIISYFLSRKYYPIPYDLKRIALYLFSAFGLFAVSQYIQPEEGLMRYAVGVLLLGIFSGVILVSESRKKQVLSQNSKPSE